MFRFPQEYGPGYERLPDVSAQVDMFPTTVAAVQKAEREFEGEDFCICEHQRKYHRASERECASCDCAIFLSPERARKTERVMKTKIEKFIDAACWIVVSAAAIYFITRIIVGLINKFVL